MRLLALGIVQRALSAACEPKKVVGKIPWEGFTQACKLKKGCLIFGEDKDVLSILRSPHYALLSECACLIRRRAW
eukprot:1785101-Amphidinium_carterae.3